MTADKQTELYSSEEAYETAIQSTEGEDRASEWQASGYFDRRPPTTYRSVHQQRNHHQFPMLTINSQPSTWTSSGRSYSESQAAFNRTVPYEYFQTSSGPSSPAINIPSGAASPGYFPDPSYISNPANLQYVPEVPLSPVEDEVDELRAREEESEIPEPQPKRKRGRPRINRRESAPSSSKSSASQRVPHNQVERKYRETLNAEMERLRINVPTLPQHDGTSLAGPPKPSKATVLAAAVDYIKQLEAETERLAEQNEDLKGGSGGESSSRGGHNYGY